MPPMSSSISAHLALAAVLLGSPGALAQSPGSQPAEPELEEPVDDEVVQVGTEEFNIIKRIAGTGLAGVGCAAVSGIPSALTTLAGLGLLVGIPLYLSTQDEPNSLGGAALEGTLWALAFWVGGPLTLIGVISLLPCSFLGLLAGLGTGTIVSSVE